MTAAELSAAALDAALREDTSPERAAGQKRYLKSDLTFYGLTVPEIRKVAKGWAREHPDFSHDELVELVVELWSQPVHERRSLVVELLSLYEPKLGPNDAMLVPEDAMLVSEDAVLVSEDIVLIERLLRESRTWALVDPLATAPASSLLDRHPGSDRIVERWATDADFWIRRSALLVHLLPLRRGTGDFERFGRIAEPMLDEKEFFIRKAIGWVLRDMSRTQPDLVYSWIAPRAHMASGVTIREAVKYLSPDAAATAMTAYRTGEPVDLD